MLQTWEPCSRNAWNSQTDSEISMTMAWIEHRLLGCWNAGTPVEDLSSRSSLTVETNTLEEGATSSTRSHGEVRFLVCNMLANSKGRREHAADHRQVCLSCSPRGTRWTLRLLKHGCDPPYSLHSWFGPLWFRLVCKNKSAVRTMSFPGCLWTSQTILDSPTGHTKTSVPVVLPAVAKTLHPLHILGMGLLLRRQHCLAER